MVLGKSVSWKEIVTFFPNDLTVGIFFCGGEKRMFWIGLLTDTSSLNSKVMLFVVTFVEPFIGMAETNTGGSLSFGPPWGPEPLFAQDCKARK